jgi:hypothetical protein
VRKRYRDTWAGRLRRALRRLTRAA